MKGITIPLAIVCLVACSQAPIEVVRTVEVTRLVEATVEIEKEVTRRIEVPIRVEVEATRLVEVTLAPTSAPSGGVVFARNYLGEVTTGNVTMELGRVLFAQKDALPIDFGEDFDPYPYVGEIVVRITNNADYAVSWFASDWYVRVNEMQYALFDWLFASSFGEAFDNPVFPGSTVVAGVWFPTGQIDPDSVVSFALIVDPAYNYDTSRRNATDRFEFLVDLSGQHSWEPIPDEFKR